MGRSLSQKSRRGIVKEEAEFHVYNRVWKRYLVLRIRNKISFCAFSKLMTIPELLYR